MGQIHTRQIGDTNVFYQENRKRARTFNNQPTETDQAGAAETDLNVIVGRMLTNRSVPGAKGEPLYGDFTGLPKDLRAMIETARDVERLRGQLPDKLAELTVEDLVQLPPNTLKDILTPPAPTPTTQDTK